MRPLTTHRQTTPMPQAAVASQIHQPLDIHCHFAPQIAFDAVLAVNQLSDTQNFGIGQFLHPTLGGYADLAADVFRGLAPNPMNIGQGNFDSLLRWYIYASNARHLRTFIRLSGKQPATRYKRGG